MSIKYYLTISLLILATTLPGLGVLEFFRHTEADRTLISQEMLETQDIVIPHLLGQPILTKPPVYYILSAAIFKLSGSYSEFDSRLLSVFAACLLALVHFAACRYENFSLNYSFASTLILITSVAFFNLSVLAEIDMLYAAFCAVSLYLLYFSFKKKSLNLLLLAYLAAAVAFLTKGPPIIAFFALSSLFFYFFNKENKITFSQYLIWNLIGIICFILIASIWFVPLVKQIDLAILKEQFNQEILGRAVGQARKTRGVFFYIGSILGATFPWNLPLIVYLIVDRPALKNLFNKRDNLIFFCFIVLITGLTLLSLAKGKSSRYIFPLCTFAIQIVYFGLNNSIEFWLRPRVKYYLNAVLYLLCACLLIFVLVVSVKINSTAIIYALPLLVFAAYSLFEHETKKKFISLVLCILSSRLVLTQVYHPYRNAKKSVRPVVESILAEVGSAPVYSAGMYERWISYYLKRSGTKFIQLQGLNTYNPSEAQIYWLITDKDEADLLELVRKDASSKLLNTFPLPSTNVFFYLTPTAQAQQMLDYIKQNRKDDGIY